MKTLPSLTISLAALALATTALAADDKSSQVGSINAAAGETVGIGTQDGFAIGGNGAEVIVTRNGVAQTVTKEVKLDNGFRVQPDGNIITKDDNKVMLRPGQVLTFDGKILETQRPAAGQQVSGAAK